MNLKRRLFDEILGHRTARKALHRLVTTQRLSPVSLFVGPEGVGKKKMALALAQVLVCEKSDRGCGECGPCLRIANEQSESLLLIKPEGQQIKVEQARDVIDFCSLRNLSKARVIVIDQAERLNAQASNALLKIFEEPPANTYFFLIAPSPKSVLSTVRSRAQVIRFGVLQKADLLKKMQVPDWVLESSGGRLDRIEALQSEEMLAYRQTAYELLLNAKNGDFDQMLELLKQRVGSRESALHVVKFWREFLRDIWVSQAAQVSVIHPDVHTELQPTFSELSVATMSELSLRVQQLENSLMSNYDFALNIEVFLRDCHDLG